MKAGSLFASWRKLELEIMRSFVVLFSVQHVVADLMCPYMYRAYPRGLLPVLVSVTVSLAKAAGSRRPITQNIREYYIFSYESTRETYDVVCIHCIHTELKQPHDNSSTLCMYTTSSYSSSIIILVIIFIVRASMHITRSLVWARSIHSMHSIIRARSSTSSMHTSSTTKVWIVWIICILTSYYELVE